MLNTEVAMEAVKNIDLTILEYSHSAGNESYRTKLSASYIKQGVSVNKEDILSLQVDQER
jgi:aspartate aminotransferase